MSKPTPEQTRAMVVLTSSLFAMPGLLGMSMVTPGVLPFAATVAAYGMVVAPVLCKDVKK